MTPNQELLAELIPIVAKKLEAWGADTGSFDQGDYSAWSARRRRADESIVEFFTTRYDALFSLPSGAYSVRMAGFRATSTMGWTSALQNWKRAAETKLATKAGRVHLDGFNPHGSGPVPIEPRDG